MKLRIVLDDTFEDLVDDGRPILLDVGFQRLDLLLGIFVDRSLRVLRL